MIEATMLKGIVVLVAVGEGSAVLAEVGLGDGLGLDDVFWFCAGAGGVLALVAVITRPFYLMLKREQEERAEEREWRREFRRVWDGEPAAPGRDAVPGLPERINRIDGELKRNGGSTLKDAAFTAARGVEEIKQQMQKDAEQRARILAAGDRNVAATIAAFRAAGLEPPDLESFT